MKKLSVMMILCMLILTGCWDNVELDDRDFVIGMAIDKVNERYVVSLALPKLSDDGEGNKQGGSIKSASGKTIAEALKNVEGYTSGRLYYGHTKICIIGESVLKETNGLRSVMDVLERNNEISRKLMMLSGKIGGDILSEDYENETIIDFVEDFYKNNIGGVGITFRQDYGGLLNDLLINGNSVIPKIYMEDKQPRMSGAVVIKDYISIGDLNGEEDRGLLWLLDKNIGGDVVAKIGDNNVSMEVDNKKVSIDMIDGTANINIAVNGQIAEYILGEDIISDKEELLDLQLALEESIENEVKVTLEKLQKDYVVDVIGLQETMRKNYYNKYLQYMDDWENVYRNMNININVNVDINGGTTIK